MARRTISLRIEAVKTPGRCLTHSTNYYGILTDEIFQDHFPTYTFDSLSTDLKLYSSEFISDSTHQMSTKPIFNLPDTSNHNNLPQETKPWDEVIPCTEQNKTCTRSILQALQTLCIPPLACLSISDDSFPGTCNPGFNLNGPSRKMDDALTTNRTVIELVSTVLQCPCSAIPSVQLLLVTICDRLVAWYRAMMHSEEPADIQGPGLFYVQANDEHRERILPQPITMGEFAVDPAMQMRMREQLVVGELGKVEGLIRQFATRVREIRAHSPSTQGHKIFEILNCLLRDQLQAQASITHGREGLRS
ncbi:unnamed protein product [Penicillium glandicola]